MTVDDAMTGTKDVSPNAVRVEFGAYSRPGANPIVAVVGGELVEVRLALEVIRLRAERDALRKDAARLDWLADTVAIEAFGIDDVDADVGCVGMDIYEHASVVADERGNDDDLTVSDQREGFRRMIDASMAVQS